jgi:adenine deaminase
MEALRAATIVPAQSMNLHREIGTIEPGKRADIILVLQSARGYCEHPENRGGNCARTILRLQSVPAQRGLQELGSDHSNLIAAMKLSTCRASAVRMVPRCANWKLN